MPDKHINKNEEENVEKYFDESNYNTLIVGEEKFASPKKLLLEEVVDVLRSGDLHQKDQALHLLKENNSQQVLIDAIADEDYKNQRAFLMAACWESGLDFSEHLDFFIEFTGDKDPLVSMEAITVIEEMENISAGESLDNAISKLELLVKSGHPNKELLSDLLKRLQSGSTEIPE